MELLISCKVCKVCKVAKFLKNENWATGDLFTFYTVIFPNIFENANLRSQKALFQVENEKLSNTVLFKKGAGRKGNLAYTRKASLGGVKKVFFSIPRETVCLMLRYFYSNKGLETWFYLPKNRFAIEIIISSYSQISEGGRG